MPIISKETWDKFTQEEKNKLKELYSNSVKVDLGVMKKIFGEEALQPKPLTYEDVARELFSEDKGNAVFYLDQYGEISESNVGLADNLTNDPTNCTSHKQAEKLLAINKLLNVAKFLNKDWKPDWSDNDTSKWSIELDNRDNKLYPKFFLYSNHSIVYFPNMETTEQAIQILGEDTVRLALSSDY